MTFIFINHSNNKQKKSMSITYSEQSGGINSSFKPLVLQLVPRAQWEKQGIYQPHFRHNDRLNCNFSNMFPCLLTLTCISINREWWRWKNTTLGDPMETSDWKNTIYPHLLWSLCRKVKNTAFKSTRGRIVKDLHACILTLIVDEGLKTKID